MKVEEVLSGSEREYFMKASNWRGLGVVAGNWILVLGSLFLAGYYPNPATILIALVILGNRHLGLAILVHDASHFSLFRTPSWNDFFGKWFAGAPVLQDVAAYRRYHMQHHRFTGQDYQGDMGDPDIILTRNYPVSRKTLWKWILRDLTAQTSPRLYLGLLAMHLGIIKYDLSGRVTPLPVPKRNPLQWTVFAIRRLFPFLFTNTILFCGLYLAGIAWTYGLWIVSALTTHMFFVRIRSFAEHGMLPRVADMSRNTRTTHANILERLTFAPNYVNYHLEHHMMMSVPCYKLPRLHKLLLERGALSDSAVAGGYGEILRLAGSR